MAKAFFRAETGADVESITNTEHLKLLTSRIEKMRDGTERPVYYWPAGTVIDGPAAEVLMKHGVCAPCDEESAKVVGMSAEDLVRTQRLHDATEAGVFSQGKSHAEMKRDEQLFYAGAIAGFNPDGAYIHGPNWAQHAATIKADEDDGDDDE